MMSFHGCGASISRPLAVLYLELLDAMSASAFAAMYCMASDWFGISETSARFQTCLEQAL